MVFFLFLILTLIFSETGILLAEVKWINLSNITNYEIQLQGSNNKYLPNANLYQNHKKLLVLFIYCFKVLFHYCTLVNFEYVFVCSFWFFRVVTQVWEQQRQWRMWEKVNTALIYEFCFQLFGINVLICIFPQ